MLETILVLFVFIVILGLALFYYYDYTIKSIETLGEELTEEQASILLLSIASLPEISCYNDNCIDTSKLLAFQNSQKNYKIFSKKTIKIEQLYPEPASAAQCTLQHFQTKEYPNNCKYWLLSESKKLASSRLFSIPVSLYYPESNTYSLGKLIIEVYSE